MTVDDTGDPHVDGLRGLVMLTPDPGRVARVREMCRAQLGRRRRDTRVGAIAEFASHVLAPAIVGAFCLFYVAALVATTLRLEGVF
jgi:hypothetical protein